MLLCSLTHNKAPCVHAISAHAYCSVHIEVYVSVCVFVCVCVRSAGAGRTGTFCALSTVLERVKAEGILDVFQTVKSLRLQRPHMVQTLVRGPLNPRKSLLIAPLALGPISN